MSENRRASRSVVLENHAGTIGQFCEESYTCGCLAQCSKLFQYHSYANNIQHKKQLTQKEFKCLMMKTLEAAVVRDVKTGARLIPDGVPFKFNEKLVCPTSFRNLWGLTPASYFRYKNDVLQAGGVFPDTKVFREPKKTKLLKVTACYEAFKDWAMLHFLKGLPQDMPASGAKQITAPDYI